MNRTMNRLLEVVRNELAEQADDKLRRKLILGIYKRVNVSDKMIRSKKHTVHLVGSHASEFGVGNYTLVDLEDQTTSDLQRLAKIVGMLRESGPEAGPEASGIPTGATIVIRSSTGEWPGLVYKKGSKWKVVKGGPVGGMVTIPIFRGSSDTTLNFLLQVDRKGGYDLVDKNVYTDQRGVRSTRNRKLRVSIVN